MATGPERGCIGQQAEVVGHGQIRRSRAFAGMGRHRLPGAFVDPRLGRRAVRGIVAVEHELRLPARRDGCPQAVELALAVHVRLRARSVAMRDLRAVDRDDAVSSRAIVHTALEARPALPPAPRHGDRLHVLHSTHRLALVLVHVPLQDQAHAVPGEQLGEGLVVGHFPVWGIFRAVLPAFRIGRHDGDVHAHDDRLPRRLRGQVGLQPRHLAPFHGPVYRLPALLVWNRLVAVEHNAVHGAPIEGVVRGSEQPLEVVAGILVLEDHLVVSRTVEDRHLGRRQTLHVRATHPALKTNVALGPKESGRGLEPVDFIDAGLELGDSELAPFQVHVGHEDEVESVRLVGWSEREVGTPAAGCRADWHVERVGPVAPRRRDEDESSAVRSDRQFVLAVGASPGEAAPVGDKHAFDRLVAGEHSSPDCPPSVGGKHFPGIARHPGQQAQPSRSSKKLASVHVIHTCRQVHSADCTRIIPDRGRAATNRERPARPALPQQPR